MSQPTRMATRSDRQSFQSKTKSEAVRRYAEKHGLRVIDVQVSTVEIHYEDLLGLPEVKGD